MRFTRVCWLQVLAGALCVASASGGVGWEVSLTRTIDNSDGFYENWDAGTTLSVAVAPGAEQTSRAELIAILELTRYGYTGDELFLAVPCIDGYRYEVDGEAGHSLGVSGALRYYGRHPEANGRSGYLYFRTGVRRVQLGEIRFTHWWEDEPQTRSTRLLGASGSVEWWTHVGAGCGRSVRLTGSTRLGFEVGVAYSTQQDRLQFPFSVVIGFGAR